MARLLGPLRFPAIIGPRVSLPDLSVLEWHHYNTSLEIPCSLVFKPKKGEGPDYSCKKCTRQKIALDQGSKPVTIKSSDIFLLLCKPVVKATLKEKF